MNSSTFQLSLGVSSSELRMKFLKQVNDTQFMLHSVEGQPFQVSIYIYIMLIESSMLLGIFVKSISFCILRILACWRRISLLIIWRRAHFPSFSRKTKSNNNTGKYDSISIAEYGWGYLPQCSLISHYKLPVLLYMHMHKAMWGKTAVEISGNPCNGQFTRLRSQ